jgi:Toprim domain
MKTRIEDPAARSGANGVGSRFQRDAGRQDHNARGIDLQRFPDIVQAVLGEPNKAMSTKTAWRYGGKGGLSIDLAKRVWFDHKSGENGGALALVVHAGQAATLADAAQWLRDQGLLPADHPTNSGAVAFASPPIPASQDSLDTIEDDAMKRRMRRGAARRIWLSGKPIIGTIAQTYLTGRAIPVSCYGHCGDLRFVPACPLHPYGRGTTHHPALVARVVDRTGKAVGVHVTYLAPDGLGKAAIDVPRKLIGAGFGGACVRLGTGGRVVIAEGIESALSAGLALGLSPIAALSAGGVKTWHKFDGVREVTFAPDQDKSEIGMASARAAAHRLYCEGVKVVGFANPPGGVNDWNDAARAGLLDQDGGAS